MGNIEHPPGSVGDWRNDEPRRAKSAYELPYGHPLRRDEAEDMEALREQLRGAVAQVDTLIAALLDELNDEGPRGNGYRQAMADLREQLRLRFGGR